MGWFVLGTLMIFLVMINPMKGKSTSPTKIKTSGLIPLFACEKLSMKQTKELGLVHQILEFCDFLRFTWVNLGQI